MLVLLVQCNVCQVDIGFGKVFFLLHVRIGVWIEVGVAAPEIDLRGSQDSAHSDCLSDLATELLIDMHEYNLDILSYNILHCLLSVCINRYVNEISLE